MLFARAARASIVAADFRCGTDEWRLRVAVAMRMAVVMMAMAVIMRVIVPATAGVINGGLQGFARKRCNGVGLGIS